MTARFCRPKRHLAEDVASRGLGVGSSDRAWLQFLRDTLQHAVGQGHQRGVALVFHAFFPAVSVCGRSFQGESHHYYINIRETGITLYVTFPLGLYGAVDTKENGLAQSSFVYHQVALLLESDYLLFIYT